MLRWFLYEFGLMVLIVLLWSPAAHGYDLARHVKSFRLPNGMRWLFVRRTQAPVVSGCVVVRVGGADEEPGKTGLAHMFEHMAFKGSSRLGTRDFAKERPILDEIEKLGARLTSMQGGASPDKSEIESLKERLRELSKEAGRYQVRNEIWEVMIRNGADDLNAYTTKDITVYSASVPATRIELWARVMAEMVFDPAYRDFYTERSVVAEERRMQVEDDPDGATSEKILSTAYESGSYSWSTIGLEGDIGGLTIADARGFHRKHYAPANMVGALVGDISFNDAKRIIGRAFGGYPAGPVPKEPGGPGSPRSGIGEEFAFDASPSLVVAYHKPTLPDPVQYSFDVIEFLLCEGRSSRLQKLLVYEKRMAKEIFCSVDYPGSRFDNLFLIWVEPLKRYSPRDILKEVQREIGRLKDEPVGDEELERVRNKVTAMLVLALDDNMNLAQSLAHYETIHGDWRLLVDYPKRISEVDAADVMHAADGYLDDEKRIVIERVRTRR